jgi:hypothetical protein
MRNESSSQIRHHTIPNVGAVISEALSPKSRKPERAMSPRKSTGSAPTCRATSVVCERTYQNRFGSGNMYHGPVVGARVAPQIGVPMSIKTARATSVAGMSANISGGCGTGVGVLCEAP